MSSETRNHWFVCLGWHQRYCFSVYKTLQFHGQFIALVVWLYLIYMCAAPRDAGESSREAPRLELRGEVLNTTSKAQGSFIRHLSTTLLIYDTITSEGECSGYVIDRYSVGTWIESRKKYWLTRVPFVLFNSSRQIYQYYLIKAKVESFPIFSNSSFINHPTVYI
jgi:hypothetical protein